MRMEERAKLKKDETRKCTSAGEGGGGKVGRAKDEKR